MHMYVRGIICQGGHRYHLNPLSWQNSSEHDAELWPGGDHQSIRTGRTWDCCGWCNLHVPGLQIFYFPNESELVDSALNATNATRTMPESHRYNV